jgi:hypothetical protein
MIPVNVKNFIANFPPKADGALPLQNLSPCNGKIPTLSDLCVSVVIK